MLPLPPPEFEGPPKPFPTPSRWGCGCLLYLLVVLILTTPIWCCAFANMLAYPVFYVAHGRWPVSESSRTKVQEGMTQDDVIAVVGVPHMREMMKNGAARWYYYTDALAFNFWYVWFDPQGRVEHVWTD